MKGENLLFAADVHGEWVELYEKAPEGSVLLVCGDAEPLRDEKDVELVPAPKKHLKLGSFHVFWERGEVPVPTYVFLGNHEPFAWLQEFEEKGPCQVIRNFWILKRSGIVNLCGLRIAYLSRIFSPRTYPERPWKPSGERKKSKLAGRFTRFDVENLLDEAARMKGGVDVLALHENPLFCEADEGKEVYEVLVGLLRPSVVVCGHLHEPVSGELCGVPVVGLGREVLSFSKVLERAAGKGTGSMGH